MDVEKNSLEIDYIDRFKVKPISKLVKLSETIIQIEENQYRERNLKKGETFYSLHLTNASFGHIKISDQDFKNIKEIAQQFQQLKNTTAKSMRNRRLLRKRFRG